MAYDVTSICENAVYEYYESLGYTEDEIYLDVESTGIDSWMEGRPLKVFISNHSSFLDPSLRDNAEAMDIVENALLDNSYRSKITSTNHGDLTIQIL